MGLNKQFCISGQDWSNVLEQWEGLIKLSARVGGIGQIFCESVRDQSNFLH